MKRQEERPTQGESLGRPTTHMEQRGAPRMVRRTYGIDISLTLAVVLAGSIAMIGYLLMPEVADLMMPPPLSGAQ
jgi:hypothetical protein